MKSSISIQQVLHGYNNGHRLLESSVELSFEDRRTMDILSDSAGINNTMTRKEYISGYPLPSSEYYVLAKTWYADEMQRPGCVWTHSLLIRIEDIHMLGSVEQILHLFVRPDGKNQLLYSKDVEVVPELFYEQEIEIEKLRYVIFTMYNSNENKLIEISEKNYEKEILRVLECMDYTLLARFSFCSNTCVYRKIGSKDFVYQMFDAQNAYKIYKKDDPNMTFYPNRTLSSYPVWVNKYAETICHREIGEWKRFYLKYFDLDPQYVFYNKLFRLFLVLVNNDLFPVSKYCDIIEKLFDEQALVVEERTFDLFLYDDLYDTVFEDYFIEMVGIADRMNSKPTQKDIETLAKKIVVNNLNKVFPMLELYAHGRLSASKKKVVEAVVRLLNPCDLPKTSHMNREIVMALIASNPKLIMSEDIWSKSREFQCDVIGALPNRTNEIELTELLNLIIRKSRQDVSKAIYHKMGKRVVRLLYEMLKSIREDKFFLSGNWDEVLLDDMSYAVSHLASIRSNVLRNRLLLKIDTFNDEIRDMLTAEEWFVLFDKTKFHEMSDEMQVKMAITFLPIVLRGDRDKFQEMSNVIFDILHTKLLKSKISCDEWIRFDFLLPEVEPCFAWDKCLRLRKAFGIEG